eukprot:jgi/Botrbrau1/20005/Bobra.200_1s0012.1
MCRVDISVRQCENLSCAYLYATTPTCFMAKAKDAFERVEVRQSARCMAATAMRMVCWRAGTVDLVVEADLKPYDYLALVPIIQGQGGLITDWQGKELRWPEPSRGGQYELKDLPGEVVAAGDAEVHAEVLRELGWRAG